MNNGNKMQLVFGSLCHDDSEELAPGSTTLDCSESSATLYMQDCSTYDLMCLAANLSSSINKVLELIQIRTESNLDDIISTISQMKACDVRVNYFRKQKFVNVLAKK